MTPLPSAQSRPREDTGDSRANSPLPPHVKASRRCGHPDSVVPMWGRHSGGWTITENPGTNPRIRPLTFGRGTKAARGRRVQERLLGFPPVSDVSLTPTAKLGLDGTALERKAETRRPLEPSLGGSLQDPEVEKGSPSPAQSTQRKVINWTRSK